MATTNEQPASSSSDFQGEPPSPYYYEDPTLVSLVAILLALAVLFEKSLQDFFGGVILSFFFPGAMMVSKTWLVWFLTYQSLKSHIDPRFVGLWENCCRLSSIALTSHAEKVKSAKDGEELVALRSYISRLERSHPQLFQPETTFNYHVPGSRLQLLAMIEEEKARRQRSDLISLDWKQQHGILAQAFEEYKQEAEARIARDSDIITASQSEAASLRESNSTLQHRCVNLRAGKDRVEYLALGLRSEKTQLLGIIKELEKKREVVDEVMGDTTEFVPSPAASEAKAASAVSSVPSPMPASVPAPETAPVAAPLVPPTVMPLAEPEVAPESAASAETVQFVGGSSFTFVPHASPGATSVVAVQSSASTATGTAAPVVLDAYGSVTGRDLSLFGRSRRRPRGAAAKRRN
ncbi:hypothetical protein BT63DRAFT_439343 [Microthyrium microscopicum]|uniref:Uncharacterized protein n=1 Tax=Microthyrium microscopicum TaxID=703497 RepID=A0A6A6UHB7_9PEZI|nr:hypothetical protein BT63DRAFT_439343 [Microthyrium microscopicum]